MAEKLKKKPSFFSMKSFKGLKDGNVSPRTPSTPNGQQDTQFFKSGSASKYTQNQSKETKPQRLSTGGIKDLVQCALCLEVLHNPKMLPCQHTFCMACLVVYIGDSPILECPICRIKVHVSGPSFLNDLPSNLYIDSLLQIVGISNDKPKAVTPPSTPVTPGLQSVDLFAGGVRCSQCQTVCDHTDVTSCDHCKLTFCRVCWGQHLDDMRTQVESILRQLESASERLEHKVEYYKDRCERITEQINVTADERINAIIESKEKLLKEASDLQKSGAMTALALKDSLQEAQEVARKAMSQKELVQDKNKVTTYINLHQNAVQLLSDVSKWDSDRFVFDKENFRIELDSATPLEAESDDPLPEAGKTTRLDGSRVTTYINLHQNAVQLLSDVSKWDSDRFVFDKENFRIELDSATPLEAESDDPLPEAGKTTRLDGSRVTTYINLHQNAVQLLSDVSKWDSDRFVFDKENFRIELDSATPLEAESDDPLPEAGKTTRLDGSRVTTYINLHQNAVQLLSDVSKWDSDRFVFDKENFRIELDSATPLEAESDDPLPEAGRPNDPLESEDSLALHYRSRSFVPHYVWRKTARPCGIGISPWNSHLYVCGMDTHSVLVVERTQAKITARLTCEGMLCPVHIAFMKSLGEIYVTDKWKHCVHVFTKDGEYSRSIGQKGSRVGMFRSPEGIATDNTNHHIYVVDTGNDRVQILQPDGKFVDQIGVSTKLQTTYSSNNWETREVTCTELNAPTGVAVAGDRVVVLDSGNRRVKVYNKADKNKILEFGSVGQRKGQFRQPEVITVDPLGFILVGDSGNCRVQVFKPTGQLVRAFGGMGTDPGKFGWISGIHVTKQLDIIVSDTKNHNINFI